MRAWRQTSTLNFIRSTSNCSQKINLRVTAFPTTNAGIQEWNKQQRTALISDALHNARPLARLAHLRVRPSNCFTLRVIVPVSFTNIDSCFELLPSGGGQVFLFPLGVVTHRHL